MIEAYVSFAGPSVNNNNKIFKKKKEKTHTIIDFYLMYVLLEGVKIRGSIIIIKLWSQHGVLSPLPSIPIVYRTFQVL